MSASQLAKMTVENSAPRRDGLGLRPFYDHSCLLFLLSTKVSKQPTIPIATQHRRARRGDTEQSLQDNDGSRSASQQGILSRTQPGREKGASATHQSRWQFLKWLIFIPGAYACCQFIDAYINTTHTAFESNDCPGSHNHSE